MIEKFTKEELEIIKKELKELPKDRQKNTVCAESRHRLTKLFNQQDSYKGVYTYDVDDHIYAIADFALCNYEPNPNRRGSFRRNFIVPHEIEEEYSQFVSRVTDLIEEYFRKSPVRYIGEPEKRGVEDNG